jgi:hypothetical protein
MDPNHTFTDGNITASLWSAGSPDVSAATARNQAVEVEGCGAAEGRDSDEGLRASPPRQIVKDRAKAAAYVEQVWELVTALERRVRFPAFDLGATRLSLFTAIVVIDGG